MRRAALLSGATLLLALGVALTLLGPDAADERALEASGTRVHACAHLSALDLDARVRLGCAASGSEGAPTPPSRPAPPTETEAPPGAPYPPTPPRPPAAGDDAARDEGNDDGNGDTDDDAPTAPWSDAAGGAGGCGCGAGADEEPPTEGAAGSAGATTGRPDAPRAPPGPDAPGACARECVGGGPRAVEAATDAARDDGATRGLLGRLLDALAAWLGLPPLPR